MTSLSFWVSLENILQFNLENLKIILPDSGFGTVIHTGAIMMTLDNSHRK